MNLFANLCALYDTTAAEDPHHLAVGCLLRNLGQIGDASVYELADLCHVSKSTMERLVRRLGYRNLPTFRADVASIATKYTYYNRILPASPACSDEETVAAYVAEHRATLDAIALDADLPEIRRIVDAMRVASRVVFYTMGRSFAEKSLQFSLTIAGKDAQVFDLYVDQLADAGRLDPSCLAFIETFDTQNAYDMEPVFEEAKGHGARIVLVTMNPASQYAQYADFRLQSRLTGTMIGDYGLQMRLDLVHLLFRRDAIDR